MTCILTLELKILDFFSKSLFLLSIEISKLNFLKKTPHTFNLSKTFIISFVYWPKDYVDIVKIIQCINNLNLLFLQNLALNTHSRVEKKNYL